MPGPRPVLFDLDGTLAETQAGIELSLDETLSALRLPPFPHAHVRRHTGKGVEQLIRAVLAELSVDDALAPEAISRYRDAYERRCADGSTLYPGVLELLAENPSPKGLVTNKARRFTDRILRHLNLAPHFAHVICGDDEGARMKPDPWALTQLLARFSAKPADALYVGDTESDLLSARGAGVRCCLVAWGHGTADARARADFVVHSTAELAALLTTEEP